MSFTTVMLSYILLLSSLIAPITAYRRIPTSTNALSFLERRQDQCPDTSFSSCAAVDSKLPSNFCCGAGTKCLSLDKSSSALCCPDGANGCVVIQTISCNIAQQDVSKSNKSPIFTTKLNDNLPKCGSACCPFGYECIMDNNNDPSCKLIVATSKAAPNATNTKPSSTNTTVSIAPSTTIQGIDSTSPLPPAVCTKFSGGTFMAGFFPGMFIGAFIVLAWVICTGRHRNPNKRNSFSSQSEPPKLKISAPVMIDQSARTEFLRRSRSRARSFFSSKRNSQLPASDDHSYRVPVVPTAIPGTMQRNVPVTPPRRLPQEHEERKEVNSPEAIVEPTPAVTTVAPLRGMSSQRQASETHSRNNSQNEKARYDAAQVYAHTRDDSGFGSPFQSPENPSKTENGARNIAKDIASAITNNDRSALAKSQVGQIEGADENTGFKLSPTRYDPKIYKAQNPFSTSKPATVSQPQKLRTKPKLITTNAPSNVGNNDLKVPQAPSRPETSFTDILDEAGFPATERDAIGQVYQNPSVPNVPKVPHFYQATTGGEDEKKGYNANNRI